ncbi:IucA/IucC family protein [Paenibacillus solisilvae]|uniref:IucA/IucC family protein n=1 Tax=Paenibacillus solisilvae TaxID=2486751 RepID=A0ABW0W829_9BACL
MIKVDTTNENMAGSSIIDVQHRVLEDLVNALLAENLLIELDGVKLLSQTEWKRMVERDAAAAAADRQLHYSDHSKFYHWELDSAQESIIVFPVYPAFLQPYRYESSGGIYEARLEDQQIKLTELGPLELMRHIILGYADDPVTIDPDGADRLLNMLNLAVQQLVWSLENKQPAAGILELPQAASFLELERKAAFRDRPFHPVSKVKLGFTEEEYRRYTAEFSQPIKLNWMAVNRQYLVSGLDETGSQERDKPAEIEALSPMKLLLGEEQQNLVHEEMLIRGLSTEVYMPIPVHPWQMAAVLPKQLHSEFQDGICIPLNVETGTFYASSSLRSLMSDHGGNVHIKIPLGIQSLGGLRYLSAIKLMNGQRAERLMRQALERDPVLKEQLYLCDETLWWAYLPENRDLFADPPRHLSAMVRQYPAELTADEHVRFMPMSSLAVYDDGKKGHLFDEWLRITGSAVSESSVLRLFSAALLPYFEICFRLFKLGMMPEAHGQNVILILKNGQIEGLLLRDHDALRLHVPWLHANGLEDPEYRLRPGTPDSLYHKTPYSLLSFFQMLGIHVNSYAILESVSRCYGIQEERLWAQLRACLEQAMLQADLPDDVRLVLEEGLFASETWPWKQLIRPLVKHHPKVAGSMPYGQGTAPNPFKSC